MMAGGDEFAVILRPLARRERDYVSHRLGLAPTSIRSSAIRARVSAAFGLLRGHGAGRFSNGVSACYKTPRRASPAVLGPYGGRAGGWTRLSVCGGLQQLCPCCCPACCSSSWGAPAASSQARSPSAGGLGPHPPERFS